MWVMIIALMFASGLAGVSCSRQKAEKKETPKVSPEQTKALEEMKKGVEESKKVVAARVNGVDITMNALVREMNSIAQKYHKPGQAASHEIDEKVKKEALDRLIFEELAVREAKKQGMKVAPEKIDDVVKKVKTNLGSEDAYKAYLEQAGIGEAELKKKIERSHLFEMITAKEIYRKVTVDGKRVKDEYERDKKAFMLPERFIVEDVYFLSGKDDDFTMNKAKEVLSAIKKGNNDFSKLAQDNAYAVRKGAVSEKAYPNIYHAVVGMKAGDLSDVIKDRDGLHIIKFIEKAPPRQITFDEAKAVIERKLKAEAGEKIRQEWERELKKDAKIEILLAKKK